MGYAIQTNVKHWGNGSAVRLTKEVLAVAGFSEKEPIEVVAEESVIVIKKYQEKSILEELAAFHEQGGFYEESHADKTWDSIVPQGGELW